MEVSDMIKKLTLSQKAALLQGWTTWTSYRNDSKQLPVLFLSDGPHGLRKQAGAGDHLGLNASVPATCFPTAATMANSWDPELGEALGIALGAETAANDVDVVLGPGLNIKRSPLCGRNFEYFSEDPYLAGKMAAAYIRGIQSQGVSACPKHFAVNSQELRRMSMDSVLDERTLRELYLTGFEIAVTEGKPRAIMSSYNQVNGVYANENPHLLQEILRDTWGFDGFVVSDWGGDNDHVSGAKAGANLVMPAPGPNCAKEIVEAVENGTLSEEVVDQRIGEFLTIALELQSSKRAKSFDAEAHHAVAKKCAEGAIVLLENDGILPLDPHKSIALIGDFAETPRYQGAGSSVVNPTRVDSLKGALERAGANLAGFAKGYSRTDRKPSTALIQEAMNLAKRADVVLLCVGLDEISESEGLDRTHLNLSQGQHELIEAVAAVSQNVVLVLSGGAPFLMPEEGRYRAAIHGYLGGQAGAGAMADALLGKINPSGKLNETWPLHLEDTSCCNYYPSKERTSEYREGLFVGYRYYDTAGIPVRYPFGYGLSYTSFRYSDIQATADKVTFTLTNTGKLDGAEVAQVYVSCKDGRVFRPRKELKGFRKVFLKAGESKTVEIPLDDKAFRYFNVKTNAWQVETGEYTISVAASSADVRLSADISIQGDQAPLPYGPLPSYETGSVKNVPDAEFATLLGHEIPDGSWSGELTRNDAICQMYYAKSGLARLVYRIMTDRKNKSESAGKPDLNILFLYNMPFRAIAKMSLGAANMEMVDDILMVVNGHFFRGTGKLIRDFIRNSNSNKKFLRSLEK